MALDWSALIGGFLGGSLSTALVEFFRWRARKERYADKIFEQKVTAYTAIAEALFAVTPSGSTATVALRMAAGLPFIHQEVIDGLQCFSFLFNGTFTLDELREEPRWQQWIGEIDALHLQGVHHRRQALFLCGLITNAMRKDLGLPLIEKLEATILQKPPDPPPRR